MASTYTYNDAVVFAQTMCKGIPISTISPMAADMIHSIFWMAYPWKWTRAPLTAIPLVDGTQDYSIDAADTRFYQLLHARVTLTSNTPDIYRDLRVTRHLEPLLNQKLAWPSFQLVSYESEVNKLRLEAAAQVSAGQTMTLNGEYQMTPNKVTSLGSTIVFPDHFINVFVNGILWMLYRLANDERTGTVVVASGRVQYTGHLGLFVDSMMIAKEQEERNAGDTIYPEESIGSPLNLPGIF